MCLTCCEPRYYYPNNVTGRECVEECPYGTYGGIDENGNRVCLTCEDNNCGTCSSGTCCGSCVNNTFHDVCSCVEPCTLGKWGNTVTWTCDPCNSECLACHCGSNKCCDICPANHYLHTTTDASG